MYCLRAFGQSRGGGQASSCIIACAMARKWAPVRCLMCGKAADSEFNINGVAAMGHLGRVSGMESRQEGGGQGLGFRVERLS